MMTDKEIVAGVADRILSQVKYTAGVSEFAPLGQVIVARFRMWDGEQYVVTSRDTLTRPQIAAAISLYEEKRAEKRSWSDPMEEFKEAMTILRPYLKDASRESTGT